MRIIAAVSAVAVSGALVFAVLATTASPLVPGAYSIRLTASMFRHTDKAEVYSLWNKPAYTDRLGTGFISCTVISPKFKDCAVALRLTRGQIVGHAVLPRIATFRTFAVTGGTGLYANVGGIVTFATVNEQTANVFAEVQAY